MPCIYTIELWEGCYLAGGVGLEFERTELIDSAKKFKSMDAALNVLRKTRKELEGYKWDLSGAQVRTITK